MRVTNHEQFVEEVKNMYGDEYVVLGKYTKSRERIEMKHNIEGCGHVYFVTPNNFLKNRKCPNCKRAIIGKQFSNTFESFVERFNNANNRNKFEYLGGFTHVHGVFNIKCKECNYEFEACIRNIEKNVDKSIICPCCDQNSKLINTNSIKHYLKYIENNEYELVGEYVKAKTEVVLKHNKCNKTFKTTFDGFKSKGIRCRCCNLSKGERVMEEFLDANNINYEAEYKIPNCRNKKPLPFDFCIFNEDGSIKFLIEIDSRIHYEFIEFLHKTYDKFLKRVKMDKIKEDYCKKNNIKLYKPYYDKPNDIKKWIEENKELFA